VYILRAYKRLWCNLRHHIQVSSQVFYVSGIVAALPVVVFTIWGSSERQWWSAPSSKTSTHSLNTQTTIVSN
ncbi:hypothetical protein WUBG_10245, partial [Wuchereria bancrofti]